MARKIYQEQTVLEASRERISKTFSNFDSIILSFSGGKDSSVMFHLVAEEARKRGRKFAVMVVDLEAQYKATIEHITEMLEEYSDCIDPYWVCLPMSLRNAASNFEPRWICWDKDRESEWVRNFPEKCIKDPSFFDFFQKGMEFEEFIVLFAEWYSKGQNTAVFVGIRADESLNRYRTIASSKKEMFGDLQWTTKVVNSIYNIYPIYDWKTSDIWVYHRKDESKKHNKIYDLMHQAGVKPSQQRLCQPYGDDQRRGLWLYHLLEPETWSKVVSRVSGANSMSLYVEEDGNITGYNKIKKPNGHTYKSFSQLLLSTLPKKTQEHYLKRFRVFIKGWKSRGYTKDIPDEAPYVLENKHWAPSYRRICKVLLRNDYWCKGLGLTQPKSEAYGRYLDIKKERENGKNEVLSEE
jgi:predicted phosphoadenosine phosphosulfate sulfurtransferase